jgi:PAS domain S-box-containing protein
MTGTFITPTMTYAHLKEYARFLLHTHLDELVQVNIQRAREIQLPLLQVLSYFTEQQLFEYSKESFRALLIDILEGTAWQKHQESLQRWKNDQIPGMSRTEVDARDLAFSPHTRKYALITLLKQYTVEIPVYEAIVQEIEWFYSKSLASSLETYVEIQQEELQNEKDFLQTVLDHTLEGISAYDQDLNVTVWNQALENRTGLSRAEIVGKNMFSFFPRYENSPDQQALLQALTGQMVQLRDMPFKEKEGFYESTIIPLQNRKEEVTGVVVVSRDITRQKQTEQELYTKNQALSHTLEELQLAQQSLIELNTQLERSVQKRTQELAASEEELRLTLEQTVALNHLLSERENFLSSIIDQSPFSTWVADQKGTMIRVNQACLRLFGVDEASQGIGKYNILKDEELQQSPFYQQVQSVFTEGKIVSYEMEYDLRKVQHVAIPSAIPLSLFVTIFPVKNGEGKVTNVVIQHENITERKASIEALRQSEEQHRLITDALPVLLAYITTEEQLQFTNKAFESWFQAAGALSNGPYMQEIWSPEVYRNAAPAFRQALTGEPVSIELNIPVHTHELRTAVFTFIPHQQGTNTLGNYVLINDITELKQTQLALEEALAEMGKKNKELERINTDLDNFIYTASHDLKAPIANLEGFLRVLNKRLKDQLQGPEKEILALMNDSVEKFKNTLQGLLDITKAQKNFEDQQETVHFSSLLQEVLTDIRGMLEQSKTRLHTDIGEPELLFAKAHLRSILYNLLSNAIKYRSPNRDLLISIQTYREDAYTVICVQDNGLGIATGQISKLFTMFKRLHTHVEGTGVGLYIIKRIIENNGGKIAVESQEGTGTTFKVYIPV